ncbi:MAG: prolyl oligopeptidase family serine peptidase [Alphaproteobacteria bacterium]|nr:prolyl oligopeptidase family serine peptidase [Alphaproteobacteria bacterium]
MSLISSEPFVPHSFAHIEEKRVFPKGAVPEIAYNKFLRDYEALEGVSTRRITYQNDGLTITGLIVLPEKVSARNHPLLIFNRGGSRDYGKLTVVNVLRHMAPFAKAGYLVFASNYRGNDGGDGQDEFGGRDVGDVLALLDIARAHEAFDGKRAFMLGHSRGGMMTMMALREKAAVKAAVVLAGVSDVRRSARERPELQTAVFERLFPTGDLDKEFEKRSSVAWADEIETPVLLLHGDADEAAAVGHSIALAEALERAGKKHALHIYPRGNHSLYRVWDDVMARSLGWFEEHAV